MVAFFVAFAQEDERVVVASHHANWTSRGRLSFGGNKQEGKGQQDD